MSLENIGHITHGLLKQFNMVGNLQNWLCMTLQLCPPTNVSLLTRMTPLYIYVNTQIKITNTNNPTPCW
jgi:hypothetical protein